MDRIKKETIPYSGKCLKFKWQDIHFNAIALYDSQNSFRNPSSSATLGRGNKNREDRNVSWSSYLFFSSLRLSLPRLSFPPNPRFLYIFGRSFLNSEASSRRDRRGGRFFNFYLLFSSPGVYNGGASITPTSCL